jgi:hypothetical protein
MNLLETLGSSEGTGLMNQLSSQFGLSGGDTASALGALAPLLAGGLKEKLSAGGAPGLLDSLTSGAMQSFAKDPASLASPAAQEQGKSLLATVFGGGDAISGIASKVAEKTGISSSVISSMLPVAMTLITSLLAGHAKGDSSSLMSSLDTLSGDHHGMFEAVKSMAAKIFS